MAVTLTVQSDAGDVANANGYVDVAAFKSYHDDRGNSYAGKTDDQIKVGIIRATDYVDQRFIFKGTALVDDQTTEWPRDGVYNKRGILVEGIPQAIKDATAEYALRALSSPLAPDRDDATAGGIRSQSDTVDVISESVTYEPGQGPGSGLPQYPAADLILTSSGLLASGGSSGGRVVR